MPHKLLPSRFLIQRRPACMEAIRRHYADFGCSPSYAEIAARIGVEVHHIKKLLRSLSAAGEIGWTPGRARSITLPDPADMLSNSEHILRLQRRGHVLMLLPAGSAPVASVWPDATLVEVPDHVAKVEHDLLDRLAHIP